MHVRPKRHYADLQFVAHVFRYTTIPQRRLRTPSQLILQFHLLSCLTPYLPLRNSVYQSRQLIDGSGVYERDREIPTSLLSLIG